MTARKASRAKSSRRSAAGRVGDGWQAEKSALTRQAILEAAVRCFVEHGYANTTTAMISDEASVSRGAGQRLIGRINIGHQRAVFVQPSDMQIAYDGIHHSGA